jgi:hypothetical protein
MNYLYVKALFYSIFIDTLLVTDGMPIFSQRCLYLLPAMFMLPVLLDFYPWLITIFTRPDMPKATFSHVPGKHAFVELS